MTHPHPPSGAKDVSREDFVSVMSRVSFSMRPYIPLIRKRNCDPRLEKFEPLFTPWAHFASSVRRHSHAALSLFRSSNQSTTHTVHTLLPLSLGSYFLTSRCRRSRSRSRCRRSRSPASSSCSQSPLPSASPPQYSYSFRFVIFLFRLITKCKIENRPFDLEIHLHCAFL